MNTEQLQHIEPEKQGKKSIVLTVILLLLGTMWFCHPLFLNADRNLPFSERLQFHNFIFISHEMMTFVIRLSEMHDAIGQGQWIVRWSSNMDGGYGYPFFNFYAPLSYYAAELWHAIGFNLYHAWKIHLVLMTFLSGISMFAFTRLFFKQRAATVAALLYLFAPYHILNLYVRGNVAEFTAMAFYPLLLMCFHQLANFPELKKWRITSALLLAILILTHNVTALFGTLFLIGYLLILWWHMKKNFPVGTIFLTGLTGVLLAGFFWVPAITELQFCNTESLKDTFGKLSQHLLRPEEFFSFHWGFGEHKTGNEDPMNFSLGLIHWFLIIVSIVYLCINKSKSKLDYMTIIYIVTMLFLMLLTLNFMGFVWKIPGMASIQFPWRLMLFVCICTSMIGAYGFQKLESQFTKHKQIYFGLFAVLIILFSSNKLVTNGYWKIPANVYSPAQTRRQFVTTNNNEFATKWTKGHAKPSERKILNADNETVSRIAPGYVTRAKFSFTSNSPETLIYQMNYFPGWQVYCDNQKIECGPSNNGLIQFISKEGTHQYSIVLGHSSRRKIGNRFSLAGLILLFFMLRKTKQTHEKIEELT